MWHTRDATAGPWHEAVVVADATDDITAINDIIIAAQVADRCGTVMGDTLLAERPASDECHLFCVWQAGPFLEVLQIYLQRDNQRVMQWPVP